MINSSDSERALDVNARHFLRCELVLTAIETLDKPRLEDIVVQSGLPERTVHAIFKRLADQHRVSIIRENGRRHGYYRIADWGNLNRTSIVDHVERLSADPVNMRVAREVGTESAKVQLCDRNVTTSVKVAVKCR